jgi:hypothetical protein
MTTEEIAAKILVYIDSREIRMPLLRKHAIGVLADAGPQTPVSKSAPGEGELREANRHGFSDSLSSVTSAAAATCCF